MTKSRLNILLYPLFAILFFSLGCGEKKKEGIDAQAVVQQMKSMSSLGTVECTFSKLIKCSDEQSFAFGDRKMLMSCKAYVKAGVDFEKISIPAIDPEKKSIEIVIPKGEIIILNIPAEEFAIKNQITGFFRSKFSNAEIQKLQVLAEKEIREKVAEFKITEKAEINAKTFLEKWVRSLGFISVNIAVK